MKYLILALGLITLSSSLSYSQIPNNIPSKRAGRSLDDLLNKSQEKTGNKVVDKKSESTNPTKKTPNQVEVKNAVPKKISKEPSRKVAKTGSGQAVVVKKPQLFPTENNEGNKLNYTDKGVSEIGGIIWGDFKALRSDDLKQSLWGNLFYHHFVANYFLLGLRGELDYNFSDSQYTATGYFVAGGVFPATDNIYVLFNLNVGYSYNNYQSSKSLFSYGNEVGIKIKLRENFLLGVSVVYSFYTDFTQEFFNDKVRGVLAFSGYF